MKQATQKLSSRTLPPIAVKQLRIAGFLDFEIEIFATATIPIDLTIPVWQRAMKSRKQWIERMIAYGWTRTEVEKKIREHYAQLKSHTPWDFLVHVYNMPKQVKL